MADNTPIEWADATVNAINGCSVISPGCKHCYAMRLAGTRLKHHPSREGLTIDTKAGPVWNGTVKLHEPALLQPLRWQRPRTIFWNAHGDTFHEAVPDDWLFELFEVIRRTPHHRHLILTKRAARMREFMLQLTALPSNINSFYGLGAAAKLYQPIRSLWLGVSVEDQERANERILDLLDIPSEGRFVSCEPLLGPVDLAAILDAGADECYDGELSRGRLNALTGTYYVECPEDDGRWIDCGGPDAVQRGFERHPNRAALHGVIAGGESGPGSRPMHPDWVRAIRDDCAAAGVDFHFKQWGDFLPEGQFDATKFQWAPGQDGKAHWWQPEPPFGQPLPDGACSIRIGKKQAGRTLDGATHDALPWRTVA